MIAMLQEFALADRLAALRQFSTLRRAQQLQDRRQCEAARLEKADLASLVTLVGGSVAKAPLPQAFHRRFIIDLRLRKRRVDLWRINTLRFQFRHDAAPTVTACLLRGEGVGVARVRQVPFRRQLVERSAQLFPFPPLGEQLLLELSAGVLAPGEQSDRVRARRRRLQKRNYSSAGAAPRAGPGTGTPTAARILASISADSSGCSRR